MSKSERIYIHQPTNLNNVSGVFHLEPYDFQTFFLNNGLEPMYVAKDAPFTDMKGNLFHYAGNNGLKQKVLWINA